MSGPFQFLVGLAVALCIALGGLSWSAHLDMPAEGGDAASTAVHAHVDGDDIVTDCDHCCHASAHLVALTSNLPIFVSVPAGDYHATVPAGIRPPALEPPFTPPIV